MRLTVICRNHQQRSLELQAGGTLMEALRDSGFEEIAALCGGSAACGTCHVYIDSGHSVGRLPQLSEAEEALLESASQRRPNSRLACQIPVTDQLDGCVIEIAPEMN